MVLSGIAPPHVALNNPLRNVTGAAGDVAATVGQYASAHTDGLVALALALAMAVVFAGRTLLQPAVFLVGFLPTFVYFESIGYELLMPPLPRAVEAAGDHGGLRPVLVTVAALLLGIAAGTIMLRLLVTPAVFLITAAAGVVAVIIVHHLVFEAALAGSSIAGGSRVVRGGLGEVILVTLGIVAALIFGMMALIYPQTMVIFGTAFDGAAIAIYSLAYFLGNQHDILTVNNPSRTAESRWWVLGYTLTTVLLGTYGSIIQLRVAAADRNAARRRRGRFTPTDARTGMSSSSRSSSPSSLVAAAAALRSPSARKSPSATPGRSNETETLLPTYGSIQGDFAKANGLGAPPLLSYEDEEAGLNR
jgi:hypothetical protein